jgi:hypothetical protein
MNRRARRVIQAIVAAMLILFGLQSRQERGGVPGTSSNGAARTQAATGSSTKGTLVRRRQKSRSKWIPMILTKLGNREISAREHHGSIVLAGASGMRNDIQKMQTTNERLRISF